MSLSEPLAVPGQLPRNGSIMSYGSEKGVIAEFFYKALKNVAKSNEAGRAIFDDVAFVKISVPGDRNMTSEQKATDAIKDRFHVEWAAFERNASQAPQGTPIKEWPILTVREVAELHALNIFTVEQLGDLSDGACSKFTGLMTYRQKARVFSEGARDSALALKQDQTIRDQNAKIEQQGAEIAKLAAAVAQLTQANPAVAATLRMDPPSPLA